MPRQSLLTPNDHAKLANNRKSNLYQITPHASLGDILALSL
jgi:hypothetical protein